MVEGTFVSADLVNYSKSLINNLSFRILVLSTISYGEKEQLKT